MSFRQSASAYQSAAASGATQIGLLQIVYARLAEDLLRAAGAATAGDIAARCAASNHAMMLLGHLESWISTVEDQELAQGLRAFYSMLRASLLQLQAKPRSTDFETLAKLVLETRRTWQEKEQALLAALCAPAAIPVPASSGISFRV